MPPLKKIIIILILLPLLISYSGGTMFGPQIILTLLITICAGIFFITKRSAYAFICFGFPLLFAFVSAGIGQAETKNYIDTASFWLSILIGLAGLILVSIGLWKTISEKTWPYAFIFLGSPLALFLIPFIYYTKNINLTSAPHLIIIGIGIGGLILVSTGLWKILSAKVALKNKP